MARPYLDDPQGFAGVVFVQVVDVARQGDAEEVVLLPQAAQLLASAYLRLLIFLLAILIPAGASSSTAFLMMYSAYELNRQGDNIQP